MSTFQVSLVSPERLLFTGQVDQVDLPARKAISASWPATPPLSRCSVRAGDGHRRGRSRQVRGARRSGGVFARGSHDPGGIATPVGDFDLAGFEARIEAMQQGLAKQSPGDELDRAIAMLDHYKSIRVSLLPTTAF